MDPTLLLFLKAPVPGRVKTRLAKDIGEQAAAQAYIAMARSVRDSAELLHGLRLQWVYAPAGDFRDLSWLGLPDTAFWKQSDGDLGERLIAAFQRAFADFGGPVCVIGMDSPGLPSERILEGFRSLETHDLTLGPSKDGGYYLIGTRKYQPSLFDGIAWSSATVMKLTLARAKENGLKTHLLAPFFDIDTLAEYERWRAG